MTEDLFMRDKMVLQLALFRANIDMQLTVVRGMEAENKFLVMNGESILYGEDAFNARADHIKKSADGIAELLNEYLNQIGPVLKRLNEDEGDSP